MTDDYVYGLKQVSSGQTAGGFVGRTSHAYLAEVTLDGALLKVVTALLNNVLDKLLHIDELEGTNLIHINLGIIELDALYDGGLISLTLLGLPITAALVDGEDALRVTIGDSEIELGYNKATGEIDNSKLDGLKINLIKANRSKADGCTVTGIPNGYDVYGGGAGNGENERGTGESGFAGGFVGYNDSGLLENNTMLYADVIRGTAEKTGPFSGTSSNESVYPSLNGVDEVEENGNTYRIYRQVDNSYTQIISGGKVKNSEYASSDPQTGKWDVYTIKHMTDDGVKYFTELDKAVLHSTDSQKKDQNLDAYMENGGKAVLMLDTPTEPTKPSDTPEPPEQQDPCEDTIRLNIRKVWKDGESEDRPTSVTLTIHGVLEGLPDDVTDKHEITQQVTLTEADHALENNNNIWQTVVENLPVYETIEGTRYYYKYTVTEAKPLGDYKDPEIEYSQNGYTVTVTNALPWHGLLPDSGGMGTRLIYLAGILLVMGAALSYIRSRCRMAEAVAGNGRSGSPGGRRRVRRRQRIHDRHSRR